MRYVKAFLLGVGLLISMSLLILILCMIGYIILQAGLDMEMGTIHAGLITVAASDDGCDSWAVYNHRPEQGPPIVWGLRDMEDVRRAWDALR